MRTLALLLLALMLAGCAGFGAPKEDVISFPARGFVLAYGKLSNAVTMKCAAGQLSEAECAALAEIDRSISKQILTPSPGPTGVDMEQVMKFLIGAAKLVM